MTSLSKYTDKKIGIWGFGVVGRSALRFFAQQNAILEILDAKPISSADQLELQVHNIPFYLQKEHLGTFLERNDYIVVSPGIDLLPHNAYAHKWISELDLFRQQYLQPIIAITGTVGKTSITHLLGQLMNAHGLPTIVGGNIGTAMLDLVQTPSRYALLETSSFQLEVSRHFAPDLAIWTNFFPNHLDRHQNEQGYFDAKYRIIANQTSNQKALLPLALRTKLAQKKQPTSQCAFFCTQPPTETELQHKQFLVYYLDNGAIIRHTHQTRTAIIQRNELPDISYQENWLIICAALDLLGMPVEAIIKQQHTLSVPEHRLEKITHTGNVDFYNDSKSTTPEATMAALNRLHAHPVHLFIGGISKGVDRTPLIKKLSGNVHRVYCFGKEAERLHALCAAEGITATAHATLDDAFATCLQNLRPGDQVLFSPAGASFDLFENYRERGNYFKKLVERKRYDKTGCL